MGDMEAKPRDYNQIMTGSTLYTLLFSFQLRLLLKSIDSFPLLLILSQMGVKGRIMALKRCLALILTACGYVTLHDKGNFTTVIN